MSANMIDTRISSWLRLLNQPPGESNGWIKAVRRQQNIQGKELANRMHVSPARISVLEKDEQRGGVTLKMMQKAADALDCTFVYAFIPKHMQQAKPKIRLDSTYMKADKDTQASGLQREYQRKMQKTDSD